MVLAVSNFNIRKSAPSIHFGQEEQKKNSQYSTIQTPVARQPMSVNGPVGHKGNNVNNLQLITSLVGTVAAVAFTLVFLRMSGVFTPGKGSLKKAIKNFDAPDKVKQTLLKELRKGTEESINYITHVMSLPWKDPEPKLFDIDKAKKILDEEIVGMANVKKQLIRHLTVQNYKIKHGIGTSEPFVICLDGEPGTGKTSIAEIVARAMGTPFERISLGGVSDASHVKGFKRTYKDAKPGVLISAMQDAKVKNPVILLDELDKLGVSMEHGSPAAALLDVLEPKQCKNFTDEHIELPFDLSKVTFIMTSNDLNGIPKTLQDRIKVVHIGKYSSGVKEQICDKNALNFIKEFKLDPSKVQFSKDGIAEMVKLTNDAGARNTLRNLKDVFYKFIEDLENGVYGDKKVTLDKNFVQDVFGTAQA